MWQHKGKHGFPANPPDHSAYAVPPVPATRAGRAAFPPGLGSFPASDVCRDVGRMRARRAVPSGAASGSAPLPGSPLPSAAGISVLYAGAVRRDVSLKAIRGITGPLAVSAL